MTVKIKAPAKINLYLDVLDKRPDGYHNIKSIMQTVSLFDEITVCESDKITLNCSDKNLPCDRDNLAYKAAEAFFKATGIDGGCTIHIEKNIPVAGGLAGGSTDAAAVLISLNEIHRNPLSQRELLSLGSKLGADIPFCIIKGCAECGGIGDIIKSVPSPLVLDAVIANGGEGVSTPAAYRLLDEKYKDTLGRDFGNMDGVLKAIENRDLDLLKSSAFNIFEKAVLPTHSCALEIKNEMYNCGAFLSMMSGSGPSVFGLFTSEASAKAAAEKIRAMGYTAKECKTAT